MVKRAGGLTPFAYLKGATLIRKKIDETAKNQEELLKSINQKDSMTNKSKIIERDANEFKIGIDLKAILSKKGEGTDIDLFLEEGDELLIPSEIQTIEVKGEVFITCFGSFQIRKELEIIYI